LPSRSEQAKHNHAEVEGAAPQVPQVLHYCWFGGKEKPAAVLACMRSWARFAPQPRYTWIEWNEDDFPLAAYPFAAAAYAAGNFAYVSDVARGHALLTMGGVYLDTDVELRAAPDALLENRAFAGFEFGNFVGTAVLGAVARHPLLQAYMQFYRDTPYENERGEAFASTNVRVLTDLLERRGLVRDGTEQTVFDTRVYPLPVLSAFDYRAGRSLADETTVAIHKFSGYWLSGHQRLFAKMKRGVRRFLR
jgi:mannosyltransferase OCH1-like enzyme